MRSTPPAPAALTHLRPSNRAALAIVSTSLGTTGAAIWLSLRPSVWLWAAGQLLLALAMVQWFALLHECGHETLFKGKRINAVVGQVAGFFSLIPFYNWKRVHARHHKWTGWQDVDPTTAALVPRESWPLGRLGKTAAWDEELVRDPLHLLAAGRVRRGNGDASQRTPPELREPLATLGLSWPTTLDAVKTRYKELAKRHHPDANGGDRAAEERLKTINLAYAALRSRLMPAPSVAAAG